MVTKIAILGGGAAALGVAYELTSVPGWEQRYSIDLYQIGWRLGGKCASGRDPTQRGRNHEHGLHVLGGFYHNTFQQLRPLYKAWAKVSTHAIPFKDAFFKHSTFTLMQPNRGGWRAMRVHAPEDKRCPGVNPEHLTPAAMLRSIVGWLAGAFGRALERDDLTPFIPDPEKARMLELAIRFGRLADGLMDTPFDTRETEVLELSAASQTLMAKLEGLPGITGGDWLGVIALMATIARGFVADKLPLRGYDSINGYESEAWLRRHGGSDQACACPLFMAGYSYAFAFPNGGARHDMAAGCGIRGWLRMVFGSHGSMFVHMNGGMGEVFVVPYYEVLKARGVRFHFFHRVEALIPGGDGRLSAIKMRVQAEVNGGPEAYEPLVDYTLEDGKTVRRCWPDAPREGKAKGEVGQGQLPSDPKAIESWIESAAIGRETTREIGRDFDLCVVGMSIGTLRDVAAPLAAAEPRWRTMLEQATTCPTIAAQIWREEPVSEFKGWSKDGLMTAYERALDTWCDMTFLIDFEQAGSAGKPKSLSYFCGPFPANATNADPDAEVQDWLQDYAAQAFPGLDDGKGGYRRKGELERYTRLNTDPIDLHVNTPTGSVDARLRPDGSGFSNLLLAGDWTRNNFDVGCVEAAILSARICARAICGEPQQIYGESDFH